MRYQTLFDKVLTQNILWDIIPIKNNIAITLHIKNNNKIKKELYGGEPKTFNNLFKFNDDRLSEFKKDKITEFNNDKICDFNDDILINKLSELKEQKLNIDNDQVVIEYFFLKQNKKNNDW
jgi:hypothetical protein